jgi:hypothetical protein
MRGLGGNMPKGLCEAAGNVVWQSGIPLCLRQPAPRPAGRPPGKHEAHPVQRPSASRRQKGQEMIVPAFRSGHSAGKT